MEDDNDKGIPGGHAIYVAPGNSGVIRNAVVRRNAGDGIHIRSKDFLIDGVVAEDNGGHGIFLADAPYVPEELLAELKAAIDAQEEPDSVVRRLGGRLLKFGVGIAALLGAGTDLMAIYTWLVQGGAAA